VRASQIAGWRRQIQILVSRPTATRLLSRIVAKVDRPVLQLSRGYFSPSSFLAGWRVVNLITTGAKSGQQRITPIIAIPDGDHILLIASNYGKKNHPAWYYNLKTNPRASLLHKGQEIVYQSYEATGAERDRYWRLANGANLGFQEYRKRAGREIPIMVLVPEKR
jgi:deazaflavin-dependent oxidoreductase (nitroreductase family)